MLGRVDTTLSLVAFKQARSGPPSHAIVRADLTQEELKARLGAHELRPAEWDEVFKMEPEDERLEADLNGAPEPIIIRNVIPFGSLMPAGPIAGVAALAAIPIPPHPLDAPELNGLEPLRRNGHVISMETHMEKRMDQEERAAIQQHDGGLTKDEAERLAPARPNGSTSADGEWVPLCRMPPAQGCHGANRRHDGMETPYPIAKRLLAIATGRAVLMPEDHDEHSPPWDWVAWSETYDEEFGYWETNDWDWG